MYENSRLHLGHWVNSLAVQLSGSVTLLLLWKEEKSSRGQQKASFAATGYIISSCFSIHCKSRLLLGAFWEVLNENLGDLWILYNHQTHLCPYFLKKQEKNILCRLLIIGLLEGEKATSLSCFKNESEIGNLRPGWTHTWHLRMWSLPENQAELLPWYHRAASIYSALALVLRQHQLHLYFSDSNFIIFLKSRTLYLWEDVWFLL